MIGMSGSKSFGGLDQRRNRVVDMGAVGGDFGRGRAA